MFKWIKNIFNNKPWKDIKSRKLAFTYVLIFGTLIIVFGAAMIVIKDFDSTTWMTESFSFLKWMLTTGVVVVVSSSISDVIKYLKNDNTEDTSEEDN